MKKNKLLVLSQLFYPEMISTGQLLTELCEELVKMGIKVEVICAPLTIVDRYTKTPRIMNFKGIKIRRVWGTQLPKLNILGRIINQTAFSISIFLSLLVDFSQRPILVVTNPPYLGFLCALLNKPFFFLMHDVYPDTPVKLGLIKENGLLARLWDMANRFTFNRSRSVIVIGRCMRDVIATKMGGNTEKIKFIPLWADHNIRPMKKEESTLLEKWGLKNKFVIMYSGNMGWFHDMETVMEAAKDLKGYNDMIFIFVGEGHKKKWVMEYARKWKLDNCQFHSYVEEKELGSSLACTDIGLVSLLEGQAGLSVPSKTFGIMAAGKPVVAVIPQESEIAKMIAEEKCGIVLKPGNGEALKKAILELYCDKDKGRVMGENGRIAIDVKYNLSSAAKQYYDLIVKYLIK